MCYVFHDEGGYHLAFRDVGSLVRGLATKDPAAEAYPAEEGISTDYYGELRNTPTAVDKSVDARASAALQEWMDEDSLDTEEEAFVEGLIGLLAA